MVTGSTSRSAYDTFRPDMIRICGCLFCHDGVDDDDGDDDDDDGGMYRNLTILECFSDACVCVGISER